MQHKEKFLAALEEQLQRSPCQSPRRSCILSWQRLCWYWASLLLLSSEALRIRALYSEYSVAKKGRGAPLDLPILAGRSGFSPSATQAFHWCTGPWKGHDKLGSWASPSSQAGGRGRIGSGGGSWAAFCFLFLVLELYLEVFQGSF